MITPNFEYAGTRRISYSGGAIFVPVCEKCGRYVKAYLFIRINGLGQLSQGPNAHCSKCGKTRMIFEGFFEEEQES